VCVQAVREQHKWCFAHHPSLRPREPTLILSLPSLFPTRSRTQTHTQGRMPTSLGLHLTSRLLGVGWIPTQEHTRTLYVWRGGVGWSLVFMQE